MKDLNTLKTELEISRGKGDIIICLVSTPLTMDGIIETMSQSFLLKKIEVKSGDDIIRNLKEAKKGSSEDNHDAWVWIMPEKSSADILNILSSFRERFYDIHVPGVIFCNRRFLNAIISKAPDFWRYRGNYYEFESEEELLPIGEIIDYEQSLFPVMQMRDIELPFFYRSREDLLRRKRIAEYLLEETENKQEKGELYRQLAFLSRFSGELGAALEYSREALNLDREIGNKLGEANDLGNIGLICRYRGELDQALKYHMEALGIYRELGNRLGEANQLGTIGLVYKDKGKLDQALKYHMEALGIHRELGYRLGEARDLGNIGLIHSDIGNLDDALHYHREALRIHQELGYKLGEAYQLGNIGIVLELMKMNYEALEYLKKALEIFKEIGSAVQIDIIRRHISGISELPDDRQSENKRLTV
ncbi:MAG: tetratricopeptide repeat protein [Candidatus Methanofastidiosia archaeon]